MATQGNNNRNNGMMDSIAALRSVLMLDTPIRDALAGGRNVNEQKQAGQKQLLFSPSSMTQATTPASRHTPMSRKKISTGGSSSSSPLFRTPTRSRLPQSPEAQQSATKVLEKKIQLLEASHAELEERLKGEIDQRATLKTTYEKLSEFQTKQSSQLETITESRDAFRNESIALKKTLELERKNHSKTIAFLQNTTSNTVQSERFRERESYRTETERLNKRLQKTESRYTQSESLVKSLTKEVERLNADLKKLRQAHESAMQKKMESHAKEIAVLHDKIEQTESGLVKQVNTERKSAEENYEKLQKVQKNRTKLKEEYSLEREKMKAEKVELQESLKEAVGARKESERKLTEANGEVSRLRQKVTEDELAKKESAEKVAKISAELDAAKDKLATNEALQSEKDELERRLRDAEVNSSKFSFKLPFAKDQSASSDGLQELQSENTALQQKLKDAEENRNQFQNELQGTQMELDSLKQNLEEAERIELQNEELVAKLKSMSDELASVEKLQEQLKAYKSDIKSKDELLQNMESELEMLRTKALKKSSKDIDGNENLEIIHKLRQELKKVTEELARSKEKLGISRLSNLNRLVEVAANREKVRNLEDDLEELEERLQGESQGDEDEIDDKKREIEENEIPRKRLKIREDDQEFYDCQDEDDIVL